MHSFIDSSLGLLLSMMILINDSPNLGSFNSIAFLIFDSDILISVFPLINDEEIALNEPLSS